jgi:hypothetical protein
MAIGTVVGVRDVAATVGTTVAFSVGETVGGKLITGRFDEESSLSRACNMNTTATPAPIPRRNTPAIKTPTNLDLLPLDGPEVDARGDDSAFAVSGLFSASVLFASS